MSYIENLLDETSEKPAAGISKNEYLHESILITKYMSPKLKATNLATFQALFFLTYGKTGQGTVSLPWPEIGAYCGNERGDDVIHKNEAVRNRTQQLVKLSCIEITRNRTGANTIHVFKPSEVQFVIEAIAAEKPELISRPLVEIDCYNNKQRRQLIFKRDSAQCCYCLKKLELSDYFIDHIIPRAQGGSHYKNNLITACNTCNTRKSDMDAQEFLRQNYRFGLIEQAEYIRLSEYINAVSSDSDTGEP